MMVVLLVLQIILLLLLPLPNHWHHPIHQIIHLQHLLILPQPVGDVPGNLLQVPQLPDRRRRDLEVEGLVLDVGCMQRRSIYIIYYSTIARGSHWRNCITITDYLVPSSLATRIWDGVSRLTYCHPTTRK